MPGWCERDVRQATMPRWRWVSHLPHVLAFAFASGAFASAPEAPAGRTRRVRASGTLRGSRAVTPELCGRHPERQPQSACGSARGPFGEALKRACGSAIEAGRYGGPGAISRARATSAGGELRRWRRKPTASRKRIRRRRTPDPGREIPEIQAALSEGCRPRRSRNHNP